jgi:hypothetical protein
MNLIEDVAETTGIGLGVHTVIYPDATGFAAADGQKDVAAFFDRPPLPTLAKDDVAVGELNKGQKTKVQMAFSADWIGRESTARWRPTGSTAGSCASRASVKARETGLYDLRGNKGNKIDWEMVPMASTSCTPASFPATRRASCAASTPWSTIPATATRRW